MKILLLMSLILMASCGKSSGDNSEIIRSSIIGGTEVTRDDYESLSVVALRDQKTTCSATLVSENLIITAAHCVSEWTPKKTFSEPKRKLTSSPVMFYTYKPGTMPVYIRMDSIELFPARDKDEETYQDLAVVKLKEKAPKGFKAVAILSPEYTIQRNTELLLVGFGFTDKFNNDDNFNLPRAPRKIKIPFVDIREKRIVVSQVQGEKGSYYGDSGGPAYLEFENGLLLAGSTHGGSPIVPEGYYVNLGDFKDFILNAAKKMNATAPEFKMPDDLR